MYTVHRFVEAVRVAIIQPIRLPQSTIQQNMLGAPGTLQ